MIRKYLSAAALALLAVASPAAAFTPAGLAHRAAAYTAAASESSTALDCGIFGIFSSAKDENSLRSHLISCSSELRHRGPDWSGEFGCVKQFGASSSIRRRCVANLCNKCTR